MTPRVRLARPSDAEALHGLYTGLADSEDARPADIGHIASVLAEPAGGSGRLLLVADIEHGPVVGTADVVIVEGNLTHRGRPWAIVENVVVAEASRRHGVGRALLEEAVESARRRGCYKVQLLSAKARHEAHAFYRSLGFEPVAEGFRTYLDREPGPGGSATGRRGPDPVC